MHPTRVPRETEIVASGWEEARRARVTLAPLSAAPGVRVAWAF
jgi:hypothetical protein